MTEEQKQSQLKAACKFIDENYGYTRQDAFEDYYEFSYPCLSEALVEFADSETRWIGTLDEDPEEFEDVLIVDENGDLHVAYRTGHVYHFPTDSEKEMSVLDVLFWMPLPQPPKGGEQ